MGKSTKTKQTTTNEPPAFAVPIIQGGANAVMNTFNQNQPGLNSLETGLTGGVLPGLQQQIGDTKTALQPGIDFATDTLGGKYLNSNPYIDNIVKQGEQDAGNAVDSAFSMAGRTGSGNHATDLARGVATAGNTIRANEYNQERANQMGALGALPGLTQAGFAGYTPLLGGTQLAGQLPFYGSSSLGTIGSLLGGYGSSTTTGKQPGGILSDLLSGAALGIPFIPGFGSSDRRLKTNIKKLHTAHDGLGVYEWNWKTDPSGPKVKGVIADEVEKLRPWAFVPNFTGEYAGVNYGALGSLA